MRKISLIILVSFASFFAKSYAQNTADTTQKGNYFKVLRNPQNPPKFPGGKRGWKAYLDKNINPELAAQYLQFKGKQKTARQRVAVQFVVVESGHTIGNSITVIDSASIHPILAAEAIRLIKKVPSWMPAEADGQKINARAVQYITFKATRP
jgi:protein TonB